MLEYLRLNNSIKEKKEAFVSGHIGSNPLEVLLVCSSAPIGVYLFLELSELLRSVSSSGKVSALILVAIEAIVLLIPMVLCQTILLYPYGIALLSFELLFATILNKIRHSKAESLSMLDKKDQKIIQNEAPYLTCYRSTISYLTFIAILAVDFQIFPRCFAKTESQGYGLMDVGAASFCMSAGMVSFFAKGKDRRNLNLLKRNGPLLIMGYIRLVSTKGLQYQEHVTEYGMHWNFFFTLAVVSLLSSVFRAVSSRYVSTIHSWMIPLVLLILYQVSLTYLNVQGYIENVPRTCVNCNFMYNIFAANREGILGSIGYLVMYMFGEHIGRYCLWDSPSSEGVWSIFHGERVFKVATIMWILHFISTRFLGVPVSRRSTNSSFIFWVLAHNLSIFFFTWLAFSVAFYKQCPRNYDINPPIFAAVNRHGLKVFILANLLTGAVNLFMNTLEASNTIALMTIILYIFTVGAAAIFMDSYSYVHHEYIKRKTI